MRGVGEVRFGAARNWMGRIGMWPSSEFGTNCPWYRSADPILVRASKSI